MTKVIKPFFPEGISFLKYKRNKNLRGNFTHIVLVDKQRTKGGGEKKWQKRELVKE
jgi:hypothetical protein